MRFKTITCLATLLVSANFAVLAQPPASTVPQIDESLLRETRAAVRRGVDFLLTRQGSNGSWGGYGGHPAVTGLVCMALHNSGIEADPVSSAVERGRKYILGFAQEDGSIWMKENEKGYPNYSTAVALTTLAVLGNKEDEPLMRKARAFLIGSQVTDPDSDSFGGIGYGSDGPGRPDLSNTQWALEALYATDYLDQEPFVKNEEDRKKSDIAWKNAVQFLSRVQNVPETNDLQWVVKDKNDPNYGGFVYQPDESKAGELKETLRSYGSMTYAGLKSMIYARLEKDDPRVQAAIEWASKHYTLDENPGIGSQGHYYYLHTFAKANAVLGTDTLKLEDGKLIDWRSEIVKKLLSLQKSNGEWFNENHGRWWESNPEMVTAYVLMAIESALGPALTE